LSLFYDIAQEFQKTIQLILTFLRLTIPLHNGKAA